MTSILKKNQRTFIGHYKKKDDLKTILKNLNRKFPLSSYCNQCSHSMKAGMLKGPNDTAMKVWYCDCGKWYHITENFPGERAVWSRVFYQVKKVDD